MSLSMMSALRRNEELVHSGIDDETVMMSIEQGEYYGLDSIGTRIWNLLEQPREVKQICDDLDPDYDVERSQLEQDVLAFLEEMLSEKILFRDS